jgi:hypothetical protein
MISVCLVWWAIWIVFAMYTVSKVPDDAVDKTGKSTLETSGEDVKLHSKRVEKIQNYTRNEWRRCKITLDTIGEDINPHSKRV